MTFEELLDCYEDSMVYDLIDERGIEHQVYEFYFESRAEAEEFFLEDLPDYRRAELRYSDGERVWVVEAMEN